MTTKTAKTITATAEGYTATLTDDRVSISRSGVWAGDGRWEDGRIVDCAARLGETADESEAVYEALETALQDELDEAERIATAPVMSAREARRRSCGSDLICDGCGEAIEPGDARFPDETRAVYCSMCDDAPSDDDYAHLAPYDQGDDE